MVRRYETIFIARPNLGEDQLTAIMEKASSIITEAEGEVLRVDKWGLKKLAYPIKKEPQGHYVLTEYAAEPRGVAELERIYRLDDRILKYLTVKLQDRYIPGEMPRPMESSAETADEAHETAPTEE